MSMFLTRAPRVKIAAEVFNAKWELLYCIGNIPTCFDYMHQNKISLYHHSLYKYALETQATTKLSVKSDSFVECRQNRKITNITVALPELVSNITM